MSDPPILEQAAQVATIIYTVITVLIAVAAFKALNAWKAQKKSELAEKILTHTHELKQLIEKARNAFAFAHDENELEYFDTLNVVDNKGMTVSTSIKAYKILLRNKDITTKTPYLILLSKHSFQDVSEHLENIRQVIDRVGFASHSLSTPPFELTDMLSPEIQTKEHRPRNKAEDDKNKKIACAWMNEEDDDEIQQALDSAVKGIEQALGKHLKL